MFSISHSEVPRRCPLDLCWIGIVARITRFLRLRACGRVAISRALGATLVADSNSPGE